MRNNKKRKRKEKRMKSSSQKQKKKRKESSTTTTSTYRRLSWPLSRFIMITSFDWIKNFAIGSPEAVLVIKRRS